MSERWRRAVGADSYEVSDLGRVRQARGGRILRQHKSSYGYQQVHLNLGHRWIMKRVHRLVTGAFLGPLRAGYETNHKDGRKENNALSNLEHVTGTENQHHAYVNGLKPRGERHGCCRLTEHQVRAILASSRNNCDLGRFYGVSDSAIASVKKRRSWAWLKV